MDCGQEPRNQWERGGVIIVQDLAAFADLWRLDPGERQQKVVEELTRMGSLIQPRLSPSDGDLPGVHKGSQVAILPFRLIPSLTFQAAVT